TRLSGQPSSTPEHLLHVSACNSVCGEELGASLPRQSAQLLQGGRDPVSDVGEANLSREERRDCALVGGVEHRRRSARRLPGRNSQTQRREAFVIDGLVCHRRKFNRVERRHTFIRHAFRMCESIEHRELHRRDAHLGEHTAVDELDEGVNYALWMDNYVDALVGKPEQEMSFDYLERLVGECRAIDGDLASHSPRRMTKRVIYSRGGESLGDTVAERSAGRGSPHTTHLRTRNTR